MILMEDILMKYILMKDIFKNKFIKKKRKNIRISFGVSVFQNIRTVFFWENIASFFGASVSWKIRNFSEDGFLLFFKIGVRSAGFHLIKYKKSFLFRKYKNFFNIRARMFRFQKYKDFFISGNLRKASFWENIRIFLILEPKSFISWNTRNFFRAADFIYFFKLGLA